MAKVNELYYAKDNNPSFYQFGKKYHFTDSAGRIYLIAEANGQIFQNTRFKASSVQRNSETLRKPVVNSWGYVKLYVKLPNQEVPWFAYQDVDKAIQLEEHQSKQLFLVKLKSYEKSNVKRRTGSIFVSGLNREEATRILNQ